MRDAPQVRPGDRVRVVLEGDVAETFGSDLIVIGLEQNDGIAMYMRASPVVSVEVLEQEWHASDIVADARGRRFAYLSPIAPGASAWRGCVSGCLYDDWQLQRPLTLIHRKAV